MMNFLYVLFFVLIVLLIIGIMCLFAVLLDCTGTIQAVIASFIFCVILSIAIYNVGTYIYKDKNIVYEKAKIHLIEKFNNKIVIIIKDGTVLQFNKIKWLNTENIYKKSWHDNYEDDSDKKQYKYVYKEK